MRGERTEEGRPHRAAAPSTPPTMSAQIQAMTVDHHSGEESEDGHRGVEGRREDEGARGGEHGPRLIRSTRQRRGRQ